MLWRRIHHGRRIHISAVSVILNRVDEHFIEIMSHAPLLTSNRGFHASFQTRTQLANKAARHGAQRGSRQQGTAGIEACNTDRRGNRLQRVFNWIDEVSDTESRDKKREVQEHVGGDWPGVDA
jgi:hypothetical protein